MVRTKNYFDMVYCVKSSHMEQWFKLKSNFTAVYKMDDTITPVQKFTHNVRVEVQTKREEGTKFKERLATMHLEL